MKSVAAFVRLSRPHFLIGGFVLFALGALAAHKITLAHYLVAQLMVTAAQITAHYVNEYADYEADLRIANRTSFSGGSGVLTSGALPRIVALRAGQISTGVALLCAVITATFSLPAALVGIAALSVSWAYSMPPVRLLDTGWGEAATAITVAALVPMAGALSQTGPIAPELWWMIAVLVFLQFAMLVAFELPDIATDAAAGKRVIAVRIGEINALRLIYASLGLAIAIGSAAYFFGWVTAGVAITLVLAALPATALVIASQRRSHAVTTFSAVLCFFLASTGFLLSAA